MFPSESLAPSESLVPSDTDPTGAAAVLAATAAMSTAGLRTDTRAATTTVTATAAGVADMVRPTPASLISVHTTMRPDQAVWVSPDEYALLNRAGLVHSSP